MGGGFSLPYLERKEGRKEGRKESFLSIMAFK